MSYKCKRCGKIAPSPAELKCYRCDAEEAAKHGYDAPLYLTPLASGDITDISNSDSTDGSPGGGGDAAGDGGNGNGGD